MASLLDSQFLHRLESLQLASKVTKSGRFQGERRGGKAGSGIEFIDYQEYRAGDDYRYVDWNLFSRLEQLFIKLFVEEEDLGVHLLIDQSRSMGWGDPSKMDYAKKLAAALGYIALVNLDRLGSTSFSSRLEKILPCRRGRPQIFRLFHFLEGMSPAGKTDFNLCLDKFSQGQKEAGMAIVISDLLDEKGYQKGLLSLRSRGWQVSLIQVLEERELEPAEEGEIILVDTETRQIVQTTLNQSTIQVYQETIRDFLQQVEDFCGHYEIRYLRTVSSFPLSFLIFKSLRRIGVLK